MCMVFLDVLDKRDASLSRFSVLRPIGRTSRASLQFSVKKKRYTLGVDVSLWLFYCSCSGLLLYDDFDYCAVDAKDVNALAFDIEFIGRCGGFG